MRRSPGIFVVVVIVVVLNRVEVIRWIKTERI